MALKNYTSQVSASRSISWIEDKLARHGARQILKEYTADGRVASIAFIMHIEGAELPFHLPARIAACEKVLKGKVRRPRPSTYKHITEQSERTAWKIMADWVDAQMAMVELAQVDVLRSSYRISSTARNNRLSIKPCRPAAFKRPCRHFAEI